ncbi:MAG: DNA recombination protein RmuC [Culicoidibacterales bacterium]
MEQALLFFVAIIIVCFVLVILFVIVHNKQTQLIKQILENKLGTFDTSAAERLGKLEKTLQQDLFSFRTTFEKSLADDFEKQSGTIDRRLMYMQNQVDIKLEKGFDQTTKTFQNVIERLSKIDEAQQKIDGLSTNIISLQDILNDKKARGAFGEIQLVNIFRTVFGINDKLYQTQYTMANSTKVDLILFAPEPMGNVAIDSKFPLENYQRLIESKGAETISFEKQFKMDMKKHIDDIAKKYIILGETAEYAILFLPAEAIFSHIHAYHQDVIEYAYTKKVWLSSPTTLMAMLTTLQVVLRNIERDKYAAVIRKELNILSTEFNRYQQRWKALAKDIEKVSKNVREVNITTDKITARFSQIADVKLDELLVEPADVIED